MKFFVPKAEDHATALRIWRAARKKAGASERKIWRLHYSHDGEEYVAEVGKLHRRGGPVLFILEADPLILVITPSRGLMDNDPIMVGVSHALQVEDFEP